MVLAGSDAGTFLRWMLAQYQLGILQKVLHPQCQQLRAVLLFFGWLCAWGAAPSLSPELAQSLAYCLGQNLNPESC